MGEHESCPIPSISVRELLAEAAHPAQLELVCGSEGLDNILNRTGVQKPGLVLTGFLEQIHSGVIQVLGTSEIRYLEERPPTERRRILAQLCRQGGTCFVITSGLQA